MYVLFVHYAQAGKKYTSWKLVIPSPKDQVGSGRFLYPSAQEPGQFQLVRELGYIHLTEDVSLMFIHPDFGSTTLAMPESFQPDADRHQFVIYPSLSAQVGHTSETGGQELNLILEFIVPPGAQIPAPDSVPGVYNVKTVRRKNKKHIHQYTIALHTLTAPVTITVDTNLIFHHDNSRAILGEQNFYLSLHPHQQSEQQPAEDTSSNSLDAAVVVYFPPDHTGQHLWLMQPEMDTPPQATDEANPEVAKPYSVEDEKATKRQQLLESAPSRAPG
ncbi:hypothetical protein GZ77_00705 [Endozoicomonas montiporae]|uniref:Uncharacterized protein n=3 Tax=Endozoicomonas montiporae TaxID=1027273 RepID=A0A081N9W7_9GAMM|nr:hypothetical protein EZMO1_3080 [Endozoicomonas montiporae CL-33]KEQ15240.1 hypothetical protein GZ77_00705 [Endozoicomonas montiporae]